MAASRHASIADFVDALFTVYSLIIFAYDRRVAVFSLGVRVPYSRRSNAVLDFLRDVAEPFLRIFRRLVLRVRPARPQPDRRDSSSCRSSAGIVVAPSIAAVSAAAAIGRAALGRASPRRRWRSTRPTKALVRSDDRAAASRTTLFPGVDLVNVRNRGVAFGFFAGGGALRARASRSPRSRALLVFFATPPATGRWSGCRPAC